MESALALLEAQRLAHRVLCQPDGGGRPAECWRPGPGDDPGDDDSDARKGVTFTMGGADVAATAPAHARGFAASGGRPASASALSETEGNAAGLRTNEQTPAPTPAPEIIRSQGSFAGGDAPSGGDPPPPEEPHTQPLSSLEADPKSRSDRKPRYAVGQYVRTSFVDTPLKVVDVSVYGPTAQSYMLSHDDPKWQPPTDRKLTINRNYDRPRVCVGLGEIIGLAAPPPIPSKTPATADAQAPVAADSLPRCVKCGNAVVGSSDEYCHPCFLAEIRSLSPEPE